MPKPERKPAAATGVSTERGKRDPSKLRGSIPPLITPFKNGEVDYEKYAELVELQIDEGSHGILVNGTTAEPSTLTTEERNRLVDPRRGRHRGARSGGRGDGLAVARGEPRAHGARGRCRRRRAADRHALLHPPAAARARRVLPRAREGPRPAVDDLSHPGPHGGQRYARHAEGSCKDKSRHFVGHEARGQRPRLRVGVPARVRRRLQSVRRPRGAQLPDDGDRRVRPDERGRQPAAERARGNVRGGVARTICRRAASSTTSCSRSTRPCSTTPTRSR